MIFYAGLRTTIEQYRGDKIRGEDWILGLSTSQLISVVMVFIAIVIVIIRYPKGLAEEKEFIPPDEDILFDEDSEELEDGDGLAKRKKVKTMDGKF